MKKIILLFMMAWMLPLSLSAMVCSGAMTTSTASNGDVTKLDNSTHNDCVNADKVSWAIDKIYFYTDAYCTTGKQTLTFLGDVTPVASDKENYADSPQLGSGSIPNGTYNCMAVRIWDNVTFSPTENTTSGACAAASDYTTDICGGDPYWNPDTGASANCAADASPASEWTWIYMSTVSTDLDADDDCVGCDWNPPTADNLTRGVTLGAPLVISAAKTSIFKTTITNRIADTTRLGNASCGMLKPAFTFN